MTESISEKKGIHFGWLIVLCCCLNQMTFWQLTGAIVSVFALPASSALGVTRSEFFLWMTVYAICYAVAAPFWGRWLQNKKMNVNVLMTVGSLMVVLALVLFAIGNALWVYLIAGALIGASMPGINNIAISFFIGNWVSGKLRGTCLGVASAFMGIGGFIWPILIQFIVATFDFRMGYFACAVITAVLTLPGAIFVFKRDPEEKGLEPIGHDPSKENAAEARSDNNSIGVAFKQAIKTPAFYCLVLSMLLLSIFGGYKSNFSGIATEGLTPTGMIETDIAYVAAFMLSINSIADLISNLVMGPMIDKLGVRIPTYIFLGLTLGFFVFAIFLGLAGSVIGLYLAAFCYGMHAATLRNAIPLLTREIFGPRDYSKIYSFTAAAKGLMGGFASTIIALFYDIGGTYSFILWCGIVLLVLVIAMITFASFKVGKYKWTAGPDSPVAA